MYVPRPGGAKDNFSWFGRVWAATALGRVGLEGAGEPVRVGWEGTNTLAASVWKVVARAGAAQRPAQNHGSKLATHFLSGVARKSQRTVWNQSP